MKDLLKQALDALENSVDLVANDCQDYVDLYSKYETRSAKIQSKLSGVKQHEAAIESLRAALEQPDDDQQKRLDALIEANEKLQARLSRRSAQPDEPVPYVPLSDGQVRDLAKECGLDWQRGYMPLFNDDPTNRYAVFAEAIERAVRGDKT